MQSLCVTVRVKDIEHDRRCRRDSVRKLLQPRQPGCAFVGSCTRQLLASFVGAACAHDRKHVRQWGGKCSRREHGDLAGRERVRDAEPSP